MMTTVENSTQFSRLFYQLLFVYLGISDIVRNTANLGDLVIYIRYGIHINFTEHFFTVKVFPFKFHLLTIESLSVPRIPVRYVKLLIPGEVFIYLHANG